MERRLLTARDVAGYLAVSEATVHRMAKRGDLPAALKVGNSVRWDRAAIDRWLDGMAKEDAGYADPDEAFA